MIGPQGVGPWGGRSPPQGSVMACDYRFMLTSSSSMESVTVMIRVLA